MRDTIIWQRVEGAAIFLAGLVLYITGDTSLPLWAVFLIFFAPDLSFAAYLGGALIGAFVYNFVHIYAFGAAMMAIGMLTAAPLVTAIGTLWLMHSGFDRALGYGLKSTDGFSITHLGRIGGAK